MAIEIERKFRVQGNYKKYAASAIHIIQGYLCSQSGRTVRVRLCDEKGYLTIKGPSGSDGLIRYEFEKEITPQEAYELLRLCEPGIIDKKRYLIPIGKHCFEVDEFLGENEGLVIAEVELSAPDEEFEHPPFLGQEVTGDRRFYNSMLRVYPYSKWQDQDKGCGR